MHGNPRGFWRKAQSSSRSHPAASCVSAAIGLSHPRETPCQRTTSSQAKQAQASHDDVRHGCVSLSGPAGSSLSRAPSPPVALGSFQLSLTAIVLVDRCSECMPETHNGGPGSVQLGKLQGWDVGSRVGRLTRADTAGRVGSGPDCYFASGSSEANLATVTRRTSGGHGCHGRRRGRVFALTLRLALGQEIGLSWSSGEPYRYAKRTVPTGGETPLFGTVRQRAEPWEICSDCFFASGALTPRIPCGGPLGRRGTVPGPAGLAPVLWKRDRGRHGGRPTMTVHRLAGSWTARRLAILQTGTGE